MDWMQSNWFWWALAALLLALEALAPGAFMLWLSFAAIAMGLVHLVLPGMDVTWQWFLFAILSLVSVGIGWRVRKLRGHSASTQPLLNRRGDQLVGRVFPLDKAIVDGRGRIKIGDGALWIAAGPDLPTGARVRIVSVEGTLLRVELAE